MVWRMDGSAPIRPDPRKNQNNKTDGQTKGGHDQREVFIMQTNLNILTNKQRAVEAEILQLKNMIRVLSDQLSKHTTSLANDAPALKELETKIKQIELDMDELRRKYEAELRAKQMERDKLQNDGRMIRLDLTKKKTNKDLDEMKMKRLAFQLKEKEADFEKREILIKDLKHKLHYA